MTSRWRTAVITGLCYGISLACLAWVLTGIHWDDLGRQLEHADVRWILAATLLQFGADTFHAWRWNLLLRPLARLGLWRTVRALYSGLFANEVLPLRPGELIRTYLLAKWNKLPFPVVFSSVAMERILDGFSLTVGISVITAFLPLPHYLLAGVRVMAGVLVAAAFLLLLFVWKMPVTSSHMPRRMKRLRQAVEGTRRMANLRTLSLCAAASLVNMVLQSLPYWVLGRAFHLPLLFWGMLAAFIITRTATVVPSGPGNAGLLQMACVLALGLFSIDKTRALGFSALLFLALTLPLLAGGAILVAFTGVRIRDLRRDTAALREPGTSPP